MKRWHKIGLIALNLAVLPWTFGYWIFVEMRQHGLLPHGFLVSVVMHTTLTAICVNAWLFVTRKRRLASSVSQASLSVSRLP